MTRRSLSIAFNICIAALFLIWMPIAPAKQQSSSAMSTNPHAYWSWRLIDGRKCWYEGKPMLSKSSLEWPAHPTAQPDSHRALGGAVAEARGSPLDSQAWAPSDTDTFEALWRTRVEQH